VSEPIRVLLADDHPLVRSGIRATLDDEADIELVAEASDAHEVLELSSETQADVILLDVSMPGPSLIKTIAAIKERSDCRVLLLTAYDDDAYVRGAIRAGVAGYLLKDEAAEALVDAIRTVHKGNVWFSRSIVEKMYEWRASEERSAELPELTNREKDVLEAIAKGWNNSRIAESLGLAEQTVRNYASSIYDKLGLHSRAEVIVWARKNGYADD
jgi:DNA-binding NarL/FixJ family response regulator